MDQPFAGLRPLYLTPSGDGGFSAAPAVTPSAPMSSIQPNPAQADPPTSSGDTISVGNVTKSGPVTIGAGAITQIFQHVLLPASADERSAALWMIERVEELFGGRETALAVLDTSCCVTTNQRALLLGATGSADAAEGQHIALTVPYIVVDACGRVGDINGSAGVAIGYGPIQRL
jgi:hypothetical protein